MSNDEDDPATEDEGEDLGIALPPPDSGWALVATSVDGDVSWEPEWDSTYRAVTALSLLGELDDHKPDWDSLLRGFRHLQALKSAEMDWPPLADIEDFTLIGDMYMTLHGDNDYGVASMLYIDADTPAVVAALSSEFEQLANRLRAYPPLEPFIEYM
jgi:hypothetical protein